MRLDMSQNPPINWQWVSVGDICSAIRGVTFPGGEGTQEPGKERVACLTTSGVQEEVNWTSRRFILKSRVTDQKQILRPGDILVSTANSKELVGKSCLVEILPFECTFGAFVTVLRPNDQVLPHFLARLMQTRKFMDFCYTNSSNTTNISNLRTTELLDLQIPLPPLAEQRRIAAILEKADRLRRRHRYALELSAGYLQAVFVEMFGNPVRNERGWKWETIGDVVASSQYGTSNKSNSEGKGYPILGMGNITYSGDIDVSSLSYVELSQAEFSELQLVPGDVIFNRTNSTELVGKTAHWKHNFDAVIASYLVKLKLKPVVLPDFFVALLNTRYYKRIFQERCKTAVGQSNVSPTLLKEFPIFTPSLAYQQQYAQIVKKHNRLRAQQQEALRQAEHLFQTLLARAFRGELRTKDEGEGMKDEGGARRKEG